ncbi:MAG: hypothetical protein WCC97_02045 [Candidatus Acidiferrales bacterium]
MLTIGTRVLYNRPDPAPEWWPKDPDQLQLPAIVTTVFEDSVNLSIFGAVPNGGASVLRVKFGDRPGEWSERDVAE